MAKPNIHVTHRVEDKVWAVITEGSERAAALCETQKEALKLAKPMAERNKVELVIHDIKNRIRDKDSYGNDPPSIKDTKF